MSEKRLNLRLRVEVEDAESNALMSETEHAWRDLPYVAALRLEGKLIEVLQEGLKMGEESLKLREGS